MSNYYNVLYLYYIHSSRLKAMYESPILFLVLLPAVFLHWCAILHADSTNTRIDTECNVHSLICAFFGVCAWFLFLDHVVGATLLLIAVAIFFMAKSAPLEDIRSLLQGTYMVLVAYSLLN